jgi:hypothetical protein
MITDETNDMTAEQNNPTTTDETNTTIADATNATTADATTESEVYTVATTRSKAARSGGSASWPSYCWRPRPSRSVR